MSVLSIRSRGRYSTFPPSLRCFTALLKQDVEKPVLNQSEYMESDYWSNVALGLSPGPAEAAGNKNAENLSELGLSFQGTGKMSLRFTCGGNCSLTRWECHPSEGLSWMKRTTALMIDSPRSSRCVCSADQHSSPSEYLRGHPVLDGSRGQVSKHFVTGTWASVFCISALCLSSWSFHQMKQQCPFKKCFKPFFLTRLQGLSWSGVYF